MKKTVFLLLFFLTSIFAASAEDKAVILDTYRKGNTDKNTQPARAPFHLPIEVRYDSEKSVLTVSNDSELAGEVFLYGNNGMIVGYSSCLNATFEIERSFTHTILIDSDGWYAIGKVE